MLPLVVVTIGYHILAIAALYTVFVLCLPRTSKKPLHIDAECKGDFEALKYQISQADFDELDSIQDHIFTFFNRYKRRVDVDDLRGYTSQLWAAIQNREAKLKLLT